MKKISIIALVLISFICPKVHSQYSAAKLTGFGMVYPRVNYGRALNSGGIGISYEHSMSKHFSWSLSFNYFQQNIQYPVVSTATDTFMSKTIAQHYGLSSEIRFYFNKKYNGAYLGATICGDYIIGSDEYYANGVDSTHYNGHFYNSYYGGLGAGYSIPVNKNFNLEIHYTALFDLTGFTHQFGFSAVYILGK
ncbi:MAG: DUF3575 domain-containing protein [Bacteroidia bacterium]